MSLILGAKVNSATGGTITNLAGYTVHTFTSSATFTPSTTGFVEALVVGGGGGGAGFTPSNGGAGGGGAALPGACRPAGQPSQAARADGGGGGCFGGRYGAGGFSGVVAEPRRLTPRCRLLSTAGALDHVLCPPAWHGDRSSPGGPFAEDAHQRHAQPV